MLLLFWFGPGLPASHLAQFLSCDSACKKAVMLWCPSPFAWPFACESPNERFRAIRPQLEAREPRESREPRPPEEAPEAAEDLEDNFPPCAMLLCTLFAFPCLHLIGLALQAPAPSPSPADRLFLSRPAAALNFFVAANDEGREEATATSQGGPARALQGRLSMLSISAKLC